MESAFSLELFVLQKRVKEISSNSHTAANSVDSIFTLVVVGAGFSDVVVGSSVVVLVVLLCFFRRNLGFHLHFFWLRLRLDLD